MLWLITSSYHSDAIGLANNVEELKNIIAKGLKDGRKHPYFDTVVITEVTPDHIKEMCKGCEDKIFTISDGLNF